MPVFPVYCPECDNKIDLIEPSHKDYREKIDAIRCECGAAFRPDFSKEARNTYAPVIDFKPHYCYALGKKVSTKREMMNEAAKQGVKLNRSY